MGEDELIQNKIADCKEILNSFPGVLIIHHLHLLTVVFMSDNGLRILDVTMKDLDEMGADYHKRFFNQEEAKEYIPKITDLLERNNDEEYISFFQEVRTDVDADFTLWYTGVKVFLKDEQGQPLLLISTSLPVDPEHNFSNKVERLLEENSFLRRNKDRFASLSKREKEILKLASVGFNNAEIAAQLFLAEETVKTHRRNIRKKLKISNRLDLLKFAQAFDLV